jgi:hypothetical protein
MATLYGLSKYMISPMAHQLAEARHDFASHTQEQLTELNKKLVGSVSIDPAIKIKKTTSEATTYQKQTQIPPSSTTATTGRRPHQTYRAAPRSPRQTPTPQSQPTRTASRSSHRI